MSASDSPPRRAPDTLLPYEQAAARAAVAQRGGWTGFWILTWAAVVGLAAALLGAALLLGRAMLDVVELVVTQVALEENVPPRTLEVPTEQLTEAATLFVGEVQIWAWAVTTICVVLMVTALRLTARSEGGRRWSRLLLALLTGNVLAGSVYLWLTLVPALASRADVLRAAVIDLARTIGEPVDRGLLDALLDPAGVTVAVWMPAVLVGGPTALLWLAAGRRSLREWCSPPASTAAR